MIIVTEREYDVAALTAADLMDKEIAARLHITVQTVKNHQIELKRKIGASTRVGVALAFERGQLAGDRGPGAPRGNQNRRRAA